MDFTIRGIIWQDFHDIINNYYSYFKELNSQRDFGIIFPHEKPEITEEIEWFSSLYKDVQTGNAIAVVAQYDNKVVGLCDIRRKGPNSELDHIGILGITVRREFRGTGIGKALLKDALQRNKGVFEIVLLDVFSTNQIAINLYKKLGFKEYGYLKNAVKRGNEYIDEIKMYYNVE